MESDSLDRPKISRLALRLFSSYSCWYIARSFRALRLSGRSNLAGVEDLPLLLYLNHPSWWDPLVALVLSQIVWPGRSHYGPIDSASLAKYKLFERLGFFGVDPAGTLESASRFLRIGSSVLTDSSSALWVTAQGTFADPRRRPTQLRNGLGHLIRRVGRIAALPVAVEYPFWMEKYPEALVRFGSPVLIEGNNERSGREWTLHLAERLEETQNRLAEDAIDRRTEAFEVLLQGSAGVGGIYDLWRTARARMRGRKFDRAHGQKL